MKIILIILLMTLTSCVTATYKKDGDTEKFKITSFFKSVDGLQVEKGQGKFSLEIDSTASNGNAVSDLLEIMRFMNEGG